MKKFFSFLSRSLDNKYFWFAICTVHFGFAFYLVDLYRNRSDWSFYFCFFYFIFAISIFDKSISPVFDPLFDKLIAKFKKARNDPGSMDEINRSGGDK